MRAALVSAAVVISFFAAALANTEKTIFLGPEAVNVPLAHPTLSDLRLRTLTPTNNTLRTRLPARFPSADQPQGPATWLLLDHLTPKQRYEVRVCWPATQPTDFTVSTFPLATVWDTPELMASLRAYSVSREQSLAPEGGPPPPGSGNGSGNGSDSGPSEREASVLLLRILAAADYYTTDASLMSSVPPVDVDIILDPFLFNLLPRSLAGTACYIVAVAVAAYLLSRRIVSGIHRLIASADADVRQEAIKKRQ
ncbi:hypothetical protein MYCTH_2312211 [Thermothelomyces thermophilus ATCC 42464]|uniref:Uncharacterized protein n=1 Tax=Thermothelomyces thermophilus (strain ATCC 42464 / BCRC 31852 / DSM 1799) TaxID=573729 RepID=G2QQ67_THET4|nr:uncharacterized protein MYCTH_2312211 [Thermothelomyces thermophilus ATCC 42464]AEO61730.1 hypothetical protein MYCTH_2312211 [Thermothelomyces thermophilus ATCC 42464]